MLLEPCRSWVKVWVMGEGELSGRDGAYHAETHARWAAGVDGVLAPALSPPPQGRPAART